MEAPIRTWLMLCDGAQVIDGKFFILGGGFESFGADPQPFALAGRIDMPPSALGSDHKWELYLEDTEGRSVLPAEVSPISQQFAISDIPGFDDAYVSIPFVVSFGALQLAPGQRYVWRLYVDGRTDDTWFLNFTVRAPINDAVTQQAPARPALSIVEEPIG
jgi:hypothetical protein